jgi:hypothetical protein
MLALEIQIYETLPTYSFSSLLHIF